jgi:hypothetical protein
MHFNCYSRPAKHSHQPRVRPSYGETMFKRKATTALNSSRRWFSHRSSGPRKSSSSYALTRNAAVVATSLAAVAAATITSQKFFNEGPIHNDAYPSNLKANATLGLRVGGRDGEEDELRLLVWGSNRYVLYCIHLRVDSLIRSRHDVGFILYN